MRLDVTFPVLAGLFETLPMGLVALDRRGDVVIFNRAEEHLAQRKKSDVIGRSFFGEVAPCMNVKELAGEFFERIGRGVFERKVEFNFPFPILSEPRDVIVTMRSFEVGDEPFGALMIEDVSLRRSIDRMRELLAALLVHDFKNPLAIVTANLGFLSEHPALKKDDDAREAIADSSAATLRLNRMVMNLLAITRLETNALPLDRRLVTASALLEGIAHAHRAGASDRAIEVQVDPRLTLHADEDVMRRCLENLVQNAARYARSRIILRAYADETRVAFEVEDDGPGVPPALRDLVFDRNTSGSTTRAGNFGLGLTLVRLAARAHGGDVEVSQAASGGALFRVKVLR